jgi:RHS repeat-associated protein
MRKIRFRFLYILVFQALIYCSPTPAQVATGTPPFGSFGGGPDVINLANLNAHLTVPVFGRAGRGMPLTYSLAYDTSVWYPTTSNGVRTWEPTVNWGWTSSTAAVTGHLSTRIDVSRTCPVLINPKELPVDEELVTTYTWTYFDTFGAVHSFPGSTSTSTSSPCGPASQTSLNSTATDGSGYTLSATGAAGSVYTRKGTLVGPPTNQFSGIGTQTDRNGNVISVDGSGNITDTLGTVALIVAGSGTPSSPITFTYTPPSGTNVSYTVKYGSYNVTTSFGCSGVAEYTATAVSLVSEIDLPDGTKYLFSYEDTVPGNSSTTTGRLASVQLPTGGTISYKYTGSNNGIECSDGSAAGLSRTTPDGEWQYARVAGSGNAWTTTITDPSNNQTVLNFQSIISAAGNPTAFYETERQIYQGSTSGALLKTTFTCYNASTPNCNATTVAQPITERSLYVQWPGSGGLESRTDTLYNNYGSVTEKDEYAYGPGAPGAIVRKTLTTYASLGNGIVGMPASVTVEDGSGTVKAETTYGYDQGTVTATSGTPQHAAVSGSRGNATSSVIYLVQGSATLTKNYSYYDTGNIYTATDVNGAVTTYTYGSGTSCGNSFATSVSEPLSLSRSMVWNCTGGVQTSVTDENGQLFSTSYNDAYFWRPNKVTDAAYNVANFTYDASVSVEGSVVFGSSTTDALTTVDGLGRSHISQIKESPTSGTYDSVETDYDSLGRPDRITLPYRAAASTTNSGAPSTQTSYDALGRKLQVTDSAGKSVIFSYVQNDTYRTLGPAPTGENTKRKQFEYDALGRLTSVCEVTNTTGSASCRQTNAATGYLTQYTYDVLNNLISVTQNAQSPTKQTRSYTYDGLGRLTSETTPEGGTVTNQYDTSNICWTAPSNGDLRIRTDNAGNVTCFLYDQLHRITDVSGWKNNTWYAGNGPCRRFRYDATGNGQTSPPSGSNFANLAGRLMEAETDACTTGGPITDEWFSYTALGQPSDVYESTPHSGEYYHTGASYWPNGVPSGITGVVYSVNYNVDGEGRVNSTSNVAGQNLLTSVSYNAASQPTQVTFGSGDSDAFTYDPNSGRMTQYNFSVNGQSLTGTLTWNAIGTLETLAVTDPFYSGGNQSCNYTHDDISRIASANCGSPWAQTFMYDAFGNISKSGTISFQPSYSYLTNQMTQVGGSTPSYDANGNVLSDTAHTYTWDAYGKPITIDGVTLTYDALGRMVEQNRSGTYTEIDYAPTGAKLQLLQGANAIKDFTPLPGGAMAVDLASVGGLAYYRHSDWLGSSRLASTPSRTIYYDGAYAPFGENYAQTGTTDLSFTGMNQDTVANLFDFPAREYNAIHGRWPSPDPAGLSSVQPGDPQTLNRYTYVRNSPLGLVDPLGLYCADENGDVIEGVDDSAGCDVNGGVWITVDGAPNETTTVYVDGNDGPSTDPAYGGDQGPGGGGYCYGPCPFGGIFGGGGIVPSGGSGSAANDDPQAGVPANPCSSAGSAPDPSAYVAQVQQAGSQFPARPFDSVNSLMNQLNQFTTLLGFHSGGSLDAQSEGGSRAYGNYVFGAAMSAAGYSITFTLTAANTYAGIKNAQYPGFTMDQNYPAIPQANVANITNGYNAQQNGTLCHK